MFLKLILLTIISLSSAEEKSCVIYLLDSDFINNFELSKCGDNSRDLWHVVNYKSINIITPLEGSDSALQASSQSCTRTSIGPISKGTLEFKTYISSSKCELRVTVFDDSDNGLLPLFSHFSKPADDDFDTGWRVVTLDIENDISDAWIQLQATCNNGDVLVSSIKHIPRRSSPLYCEIYSKPSQGSFEEFIFYSKDIPNDSSSAEEDEYSGSGYDELDTQIEIENLREDPEEGPRIFWTPLAIGVTVVGGVVFVVLAYAAFQCGKIKGTDELRTILWEEPETTVSIPRARAVR